MKTRTVAATAGIALLTIISISRADFTLQSQTFSVDSKSQTADFTLTFNQVPNFTTIDAAGSPVNSFQVDFNGNYNPASSAPFIDTVTGVVRGDEIHIASDLPIRAATGDGGPNSGGWGPQVGAVPFSLVGDTISFSVPAADLGWIGKNFKFDTISLSDGHQTASNSVTAVPTPSAFTSGIAGLILVGGISLAIRKQTATR